MGFEPTLCFWQQTGCKCASLLCLNISVQLQTLSIQTKSLNGFIRSLRGYVKTFSAALPFMLRNDH